MSKKIHVAQGSGKTQSLVELMPVLMDGKPFVVDNNGTMAINQAGKAVRLVDREKTNSRFK